MEELLSLCRKVTLQGNYHVCFDYSGNVDAISVFIYDAARWEAGEGVDSMTYSVHNVAISEDLIEVIDVVKGYLV